MSRTPEGRSVLEEELKTWLEYQKAEGREFPVIVCTPVKFAEFIANSSRCSRRVFPQTTSSTTIDCELPWSLWS